MRFSKYLALIAVAVMGVSSCEEDKFTTNETDTARGTVLYASTDQSSLSKLTFTENTDDEGNTSIDLQWEADDAFTIYDSEGDRLGDFICTDESTGAFFAEGVKLTVDEEYTVIYPASEELTLTAARTEKAAISTQDGNTISDLDGACYMEDTFTHSVDGDGNSTTEISFSHQLAVMTFSFISAVKPEVLVFENGEDMYTVNYDKVTASDDNAYTSYIMINPCGATSRTLSFSLYANSEDKEAYDVRTVTSSKEYLAGCRYTSPLSDLEATIFLGEGTAVSPFLISNSGDLVSLATKVNGGVTTETSSISKSSVSTYSSAHYKLTNDVDLKSVEFTPIGSYSSFPFTGVFDGASHKISGLKINGTSSYCALFAYIKGATIKNLGVAGEVYTTGAYAGGIVALADNSTIINCYNEASVEAGGSIAGGVVAYTNDDVVVANCYNIGAISSGGNSAGIIGRHVLSCDLTLANCYNTGEITGGSSFDINSIATSGGTATGEINVTNCYYLSGLASDENARSMSEEEMKSADFVTLLNSNASIYNAKLSGDEKACAWQTGSTYPILDYDNEPTYTAYWNGAGTGKSPYEISSASDLETLSAYVSVGYDCNGVCFEMKNDIDLESKEFAPIGVSATKFKGVFNGAGYEIKNLKITANASENYQSLFGRVEGAAISNLTVSGEVKGSEYTSGVVASADFGTIVINCCNKATITSTESFVGGIAGNVYTNISAISYVVNCSNEGTINATSGKLVGGIAGNANNCYIKSCCNVGTVTNGSPIICTLNGSAEVNDCYYLSASADVSSDYGEEKSVSEMRGTYTLVLLNTSAITYNQTNPTVEACAWVADTDTSYPVLKYGSEPTISLDLWEGKGTSDEPYQISTASNLTDLSYYVSLGQETSGLYFEMQNDIDLGGEEFTPIGVQTASTTFKGVFDGAGYEIKNLCVTANPTIRNQSLFGCVSGAVIANLTVSGEVQGGQYTSGVVASADFGTIVVNCCNKATITSTENYVGGIAGNVYSSSSSNPSYVVNCYNEGTINATSGNHVGGISGSVNNSKIMSCYNVGTVTNGYAIVSAFANAAAVSDCYYENGSATLENDYGLELSEEIMKSTTLLNNLNNGAYTYNSSNPTVKACAWVAGTDSYPVFDYTNLSPSYTEQALWEGYGIESSPYLITSVEDLKNMSYETYYYGSCFKLTKDIDLTNEIFTIIGSSSNKFTGTFDGDGNTITVEISGSSYQALFAYTNGATIKNLTVDGTLTNTSDYAAGIVASATGGTIENCCNRVSIDNTDRYCYGGIVATATGTVITNCSNSGTIKGMWNVGGIVGEAYGSTEISECSNSGEIYANFESAGGIAAIIEASTISKCFNTGSIGAKYGGVAGILGYIKNSGGSSVVENSYNTGNITSTNGDYAGVGGVVGNAYLSYYNESYVRYCYNVGTVVVTSTNDDDFIGSIIGYNKDYITITDAYYLDTCVADADANATAKSSSEMKNADFVSTLNTASGSEIWAVDGNSINDGYPILDWQK